MLLLPLLSTTIIVVVVICFIGAHWAACVVEWGNWRMAIGLFYLPLVIVIWFYGHLCIQKFWIAEIIVVCCFIFKKFVAYTGNHMRKVTPTPDPKDKNKEVNVERKSYNLWRTKIMMEYCWRKRLAFQRWGRFLIRPFWFTIVKMTIRVQVKKRCLALCNLGRDILLK